MTARFKIGCISTAHGLRGEVKLACFLEQPSDLMRYHPLHDARGNAYSLRITGHMKNHLLVAIEGITDRNQAELLRGIELFADVGQRPTLRAREHYHSDLIGLPAQLADGAKIGTITSVQNYGAGDLLELTHTDGTESLLPFRSPFVQEVTSDHIVITLPEYLGEE